MIHYLLYSFPKDNLDKKRKIFFYLCMASLFVMCASLFALVLDTKAIYGILAFVGFLGFIGVLIKMEYYNKKHVHIDYGQYNTELDSLRTILKGAEYSSPGASGNSSTTKLNWYSKDKLKYLIQEFEKLSQKAIKSEDPAINSLKQVLSPVIAFAAGVIADKAELQTSLAIAVIIAVMILSLWGISQLVTSLIERILFSTSSSHIDRICYLLNDLYVRDFDESVQTDNSNSTP